MGLYVLHVGYWYCHTAICDMSVTSETDLYVTGYYSLFMASHCLCTTTFDSHIIDSKKVVLKSLYEIYFTWMAPKAARKRCILILGGFSTGDRFEFGSVVNTVLCICEVNLARGIFLSCGKCFCLSIVMC